MPLGRAGAYAEPCCALAGRVTYDGRQPPMALWHTARPSEAGPSSLAARLLHNLTGNKWINEGEEHAKE